jgi:DNA-directed RNA polymerase subunit beta
VKGPKGVKAGSTEMTRSCSTRLSRGQWWQLAMGEEADAQAVEALQAQFDAQKRQLDRRFEDKVEKVRRGDDLPPGVMKMVKVFVAVKRKLQPGDKMAGRHGNKGVISKVVPRRTCPSSPTAPGRHGAEPAGRAVADERGPDPRDPHGLGRARPRA